MSKGYVKLWREFVTQEVWRCLSNNDQRVALIHLITSVNWGDSLWMCSKCKKRVELKAGQIAKPMTLLAKEANLGYEQYKRFITTLINTDFLTAQKTKCHNIYTIVNWDVFSGNGIEATTPTPIDNTCKQPLNQPDKIKRSLKKLKEVKENTIMSEVLVSKYGKLANKWMDTRPEYQGDSKAKRNAMPVWLDAFDKLHRLDGLSLSAIGELVDFLLADQGGSGKWKGWFHVCKSPMKLRSKSRTDNIPYHKVILEQMNNNNNINTPLSSQEEIRWGNEME